MRGHFHGIQGLYRGYVIFDVDIFIYRGFYFGLYDSLKPILLLADTKSVGYRFRMLVTDFLEK